MGTNLVFMHGGIGKIGKKAGGAPGRWGLMTPEGRWRPFVAPLDDGAAIAEGDRQPDIACIDGVLGPPYVGHEDEGFGTTGHG